MQIRTLLILAPILATAMATAREAPPSHDSVQPRDTVPLGKRACNPNGCVCKPGYSGVFCANCIAGEKMYVVPNLGSGGTTSDVFQCDGNGGCCDYGHASDCANSATGRCG